jgi:hypothetical protein
MNYVVLGFGTKMLGEIWACQFSPKTPVYVGYFYLSQLTGHVCKQRKKSQKNHPPHQSINPKNLPQPDGILCLSARLMLISPTQYGI